ncbi:MAG: S41 family peptidase [Gammaproteobacteria bacterium]|nr:S41 family peptidase [Gammaproteobacteria bacterium]MCZ6854316.1 S41 family peptidase [Gammaproteobacteria bacterium]
MTLRPLTLFGIVISMVTGVALGIVVSNYVLSGGANESAGGDFDEVLNHVRANYVDDVAEQDLVDNALKGMIQGLDKHSNFLDADDFGNLQAETKGHFGGIGIELGLVDDFFTIISPLDDTPAAAVGLQPGDRIVELDHESLKGKKLAQVINTMRGEPGSPLHLRIEREHEQQPLDFDIERAVIQVTSVKSKLLEPGFGYVRISQFQNTTSEDFHRALIQLTEQAQSPLEGLVLDLRNNPGGVLQSSVDVADTFLEEGLIVYTEGRLPSSRLRYRASGKDFLNGAPVVVLINQGSASASEIVAGALQDHNRATVLGSTSYGKGSVQSVLPLSNNRAIKLTTAYYYTPKGRSIHKIGITPDVEPNFDPRANGEYEDLILAQALELLKSDEPKLQAKL